jgi:Cd2+/Zn2+-exporting ATPase
MIKYINRHKNHITLFSGILIAAGFILSLTGNVYLRDIVLIIATIVAGVPIAIKAFQAFRMKAFSIELLVTIAVIGALYLREYTESSVVSFLFLFGDYLEARTL